MKLPLILSLGLLAPFFAYSQKTTPHPVAPVTKPIPEKDPVVVFDYLLLGQTKTYTFKNTVAKCTITGNDNVGNYIDLVFNGTHVASRSPIMKKDKNSKGNPLNLKLGKSQNTLMLNVEKSSLKDSITVNILLTDKYAEYNIAAMICKSKPDNIIINLK